jgi:hypothetical protein
MIWDRKYQNIDTGKFDTNKMQTINSYTLADIFCNSHISNWPCERECEHVPVEEEVIIKQSFKSYDDIRVKNIPKPPVSHEEIVVDIVKARRDKTDRAREKRKARKEELERHRLICIKYTQDKIAKSIEDYKNKAMDAEMMVRINKILAVPASDLVYLDGQWHINDAITETWPKKWSGPR